MLQKNNDHLKTQKIRENDSPQAQSGERPQATQLDILGTQSLCQEEKH